MYSLFTSVKIASELFGLHRGGARGGGGVQGGRGLMLLGNLKCSGILLAWIIVVQGPTVPVCSSCRVCGYFFSHLSFSFHAQFSGRWPDID